MKLDKAIEILDNHQCDMPRNEVSDLIAALKLGIEALKRLKRNRENPVEMTFTPLPGETDE